jgi:hypothetical protein
MAVAVAQIETSGDHGSVHILATSTLDSSLQAGLLSFYGLLGLTDIYWNQVHQVFDPGPGLVVVATNGNWPPKHLERTPLGRPRLGTLSTEKRYCSVR